MHLTHKEPIRSDALATSARPDAAGAPADEIEITSKMTEEGIAALQSFNVSEDCLEWIVGAVYEAMMRSRPSMSQARLSTSQDV